MCAETQSAIQKLNCAKHPITSWPKYLAVKSHVVQYRRE